MYKKFKEWIIFWIWFMIVIIVWTYIVKWAWISTNNWLSEEAPIWWYYTENWTTLTANKWNAMVENFNTQKQYWVTYNNPHSQDTTSTSFVDLTNATLTFTTTKTKTFRIFGYALTYCSTENGDSMSRIVVNWNQITAVDHRNHVDWINNRKYWKTIPMESSISLAPWTHTIKLQFAAWDWCWTASFWARSLLGYQEL